MGHNVETDCKEKNIEKKKAGQKVVTDLQEGRGYSTGSWESFSVNFLWRTLESYKTQKKGKIKKNEWKKKE